MLLCHEYKEITDSALGKVLTKVKPITTDKMQNKEVTPTL